MDKSRLQCLRNIAMAKNAANYQRHLHEDNTTVTTDGVKETSPSLSKTLQSDDAVLENAAKTLQELQVAKLKITAWSPELGKKRLQRSSAMSIINKDIKTTTATAEDTNTGSIFTAKETQKLANALARRKATLRRGRKTRNRKSSCSATSQSDFASSGNDSDNELSASDNDETTTTTDNQLPLNGDHNTTSSATTESQLLTASALSQKPYTNHHQQHHDPKHNNDDDSDTDSYIDSISPPQLTLAQQDANMATKKVLNRTCSDQSWVATKREVPLPRTKSAKYSSKVSRVIPCDGVNFTLTMGKFFVLICYYPAYNPMRLTPNFQENVYLRTRCGWIHEMCDTFWGTKS